MPWHPKRIIGPASTVQAMLAGCDPTRTVVIGPRPVPPLLAAELNLLNLGVSLTVGEAKVAVSIRCQTGMATPTGCADLSEENARTLLGVWA